ncbi:MAG: pilin [Patescibacteria group bacterium]|nr:pilin [Patescibacteria group bacterium]MDD4610602.1 pilin [Patescibacteria group bacterium]
MKKSLHCFIFILLFFVAILYTNKMVLADCDDDLVDCLANCNSANNPTCQNNCNTVYDDCNCSDDLSACITACKPQNLASCVNPCDTSFDNCENKISAAVSTVNTETTNSASTCDTPAAGGSLWVGLERCQACGNCTLNDFVQLAVNVANYILGIVGSLALLMFIYGGVTWLTSSGNKERVETGKKIIIGAVVGIVIVFASYLIIQFVMESLNVVSSKGTFTNSEFGSQQWNTTPTTK